VNSLVCEAIRERRLATFTYNDWNRVVEIYSHGFNGHRREVIRGYQVRGGSKSGETIGWKFFDVQLIDDFELLSTSFTGERSGHADADVELIVIHCNIVQSRQRSESGADD
jgi:hypothetical protein